MTDPEIQRVTTDWDSYYRKPFRTAFALRAIVRRTLLRLIATYVQPPAPWQIVELGGGGSAFADAVLDRFEVRNYTAIDSCETGLALLEGRRPERLTVRKADILTAELYPDADLVFSTGLIEHFPPERLPDAIRAHFDAVRPGGTVILTFPTPTPLYRATRCLAQWFGLWKFPDERPIRTADATRLLEPHGRIVYRGILWSIFLTQAVFAVIKEKKED